MSNTQSINPEIYASDGLPAFLGDPNAKPDPILPEFPWYIIMRAAAIIAEHTKRDPWPPPELVLRRIIQAAFELGPEKTENSFHRFLSAHHYWRTDPDTLWDTLSEAMRPPRLVDAMPPLKTNLHIEPGQEISPGSISLHRPVSKETAILQEMKHLPSIAQVKHYALVRKSTTYEFIADHAPSTSYAKVHEFIKHHGNFAKSKPGKIVYDAGFAWISKHQRISLKTVKRAFPWLASRKLVTKIGAQDHRIHRNSTWYVCSSMKQNLKLWHLLGAP